MEGTPWDAQSGIGHAHHSLEFSAHVPVIFHGKPRWWQTCSHFFLWEQNLWIGTHLPLHPLELRELLPGMRDPIPKIL